MIAKSLPYNISVLTLKKISLKAFMYLFFLFYSYRLSISFSQRYEIKSRLSSVSEEKPVIH